MSSARGVGEYSSSFLDLESLDLKAVCARIRGVVEGQAIPGEVINHHAPLTPRSTQPTGLLKKALE